MTAPPRQQGQHNERLLNLLLTAQPCVGQGGASPNAHANGLATYSAPHTLGGSGLHQTAYFLLSQGGHHRLTLGPSTEVRRECHVFGPRPPSVPERSVHYGNSHREEGRSGPLCFTARLSRLLLAGRSPLELAASRKSQAEPQKGGRGLYLLC